MECSPTSVWNQPALIAVSKIDRQLYNPFKLHAGEVNREIEALAGERLRGTYVGEHRSPRSLRTGGRSANHSKQPAAEPHRARISPGCSERHHGKSKSPPGPRAQLTQPLFLRPTFKDYSKGKSGFPDPLRWYTATNYPAPRLSNTPRLDDLLRDGKIYLSLSDAVTLALENNFDIAIARINLDIADTDFLRAKAGSSLRGVPTGLVTNTLGGSGTTVTGGGGPGGTSTGTGGTGTGANGLVLSTNGSGPVPYNMDPVLTGALQYQTQTQQQSNLLFSGGLSSIYTDTSTYNFTYQQGFGTGTLFNLGFNNSRVTSNNPFDHLQPRAQHRLHRHRHPASSAGLRHRHSGPLRPAGQEQSPHHRLRLPPAASLHRQPGREHLLGPGQRL